MSVSYERAKLLIDVIMGAADLGPRDANSISAMAIAELKAMDDEAREMLAAKAAEAKAKAEAAAAEAAAKAQADAEAQEAAQAEDQQLNVHPQPPMAKAIPSSPNGRRV